VQIIPVELLSEEQRDTTYIVESEAEKAEEEVCDDDQAEPAKSTETSLQPLNYKELYLSKNNFLETTAFLPSFIRSFLLFFFVIIRNKTKQSCIFTVSSTLKAGSNTIWLHEFIRFGDFLSKKRKEQRQYIRSDKELNIKCKGSQNGKRKV